MSKLIDVSLGLMLIILELIKVVGVLARGLGGNDICGHVLLLTIVISFALQVITYTAFGKEKEETQMPMDDCKESLTLSSQHKRKKKRVFLF